MKYSLKNLYDLEDMLDGKFFKHMSVFRIQKCLTGLHSMFINLVQEKNVKFVLTILNEEDVTIRGDIDRIKQMAIVVFQCFTRTSTELTIQA